MVCCSSSAHIAPQVGFRACQCSAPDAVQDRIADFFCVFVSHFCVLEFGWKLISSFCAMPCLPFVAHPGENGSWFSVPGSQFLVLSSQFSVLSSRFSVLGSWFSVPGSQFSVLGSWFPVPGSRFSVPGSQFLVLGSWFLVLSSWFSVPGSWFLVPGSWFLVPGSQPAHDAVEHATPGTIAHRAHGTSKCAC
jgi:hypothetical protein